MEWSEMRRVGPTSVPAHTACPALTQPAPLPHSLPRPHTACPALTQPAPPSHSLPRPHTACPTLTQPAPPSHSLPLALTQPAPPLHSLPHPHTACPILAQPATSPHQFCTMTFCSARSAWMRTSGSLCPTRRITCSLAPQSSRSLERGRGGGGEGKDRHTFRH